MLKLALSIEERKELVKQLATDREFHNMIRQYVFMNQNISSLQKKMKLRHNTRLTSGESLIIDSTQESLITESLAIHEQHRNIVKNMILRKCLINVELFSSLTNEQNEIRELIFQRNIKPFLEMDVQKNSQMPDALVNIFATSIINIDLIE